MIQILHAQRPVHKHTIEYKQSAYTCPWPHCDEF